MTLKKMYVCSVCGAERKDANHWFVLTETKAGFHLQSWEWAVREEMLDEEGTEHLCGQVCAHKLLDRFMSGAATGERDEG
jgi:hypothetical protein